MVSVNSVEGKNSRIKEPGVNKSSVCDMKSVRLKMLETYQEGKLHEK
jgi:hypothetical protein